MLEIEANEMRDAQLPGLSVAIDEVQMTTLLRRELATHVGSPEQDLSSFVCRAVRVRHRPGTRAVIQYEWQWGEERSSDNTKLHVTGYLYSGNKAAGAFRKQQTTDRIAFGPFSMPAASYLPELQLLLLAFPHDRNLPALQMAVRQLPFAYHEVVRQDLGVQDITEFPTLSIETVRYRAGLGATVRYQIPNPNDRTYFCKYYPTSEEAEATWRLLSDLRRMTAPSSMMCDPLAYCASSQSILLKQAQGAPLEQLLEGRERFEAIEAVAENLAKLHRSNGTFLRVHSADQQRANVQRAAARLQTAVPELTDLVEQLRDYALDVDEHPLVPSHRDLKLEHIFCHSAGVTMIDWDSSALAHPMLDVAMFVSRLWARAARCPSDASAAHYLDSARQFLQHYSEGVPRRAMIGYESYLAGAALEVALGFFGRQEADWRPTICSLLQRTASRLELPQVKLPLRPLQV